MKKILLFSTICAFATHCVYADYYRKAGGGYYELYVSDCSASGMRRALDNAVASRRAVITVVKCAQEQRVPVRNVSPVYVGAEPIEISSCDLCDTGCGYYTMCGC